MAAFSAGQTLTAADLNRILPVWAIKQTDENWNSASGGGGTTLQNDNELVVVGAANTSYKVFLDVWAKEAASQVTDIKFAFTQPSGCVLSIGGPGPHTAWNASAGALEIEWAALQNQTATTTSTLSYGTTVTAFIYRMTGTWRVGGTGGSLQLQWAQVLANAANLTVMAESSMAIIPLFT